jgi:hypothetical protein
VNEIEGRVGNASVRVETFRKIHIDEGMNGFLTRRHSLSPLFLSSYSLTVFVFVDCFEGSSQVCVRGQILRNDAAFQQKVLECLLQEKKETRIKGRRT